MKSTTQKFFQTFFIYLQFIRGKSKPTAKMLWKLNYETLCFDKERCLRYWNSKQKYKKAEGHCTNMEITTSYDADLVAMSKMQDLKAINMITFFIVFLKVH